MRRIFKQLRFFGMPPEPIRFGRGCRTISLEHRLTPLFPFWKFIERERE